MATPQTTDHRTGRPTRKSTPLGIMIICVLGSLGAIIGLFASLALLGQGGPSAAIGLFAMGMSIGQLFVLYGLWTIQSWGWTLGVILYSLSVFFSLAQGAIFSVLLNIVIVVYLLTKHEYYHS